MSYCSITDVRKCYVLLKSTAAILDSDITEKITEAENLINDKLKKYYKVPLVDSNNVAITPQTVTFLTKKLAASECIKMRFDGAKENEIGSIMSNNATKLLNDICSAKPSIILTECQLNPNVSINSKGEFEMMDVPVENGDYEIYSTNVDEYGNPIPQIFSTSKDWTDNDNRERIY